VDNGRHDVAPLQLLLGQSGGGGRQHGDNQPVVGGTSGTVGPAARRHHQVHVEAIGGRLIILRLQEDTQGKILIRYDDLFDEIQYR